MTVDAPGPAASDVELRFGPLALTPDVACTVVMWVRAEFNDTVASLVLRRTSDGALRVAMPLMLDAQWSRARLASVVLPDAGSGRRYG